MLGLVTCQYKMSVPIPGAKDGLIKVCVILLEG